LADPRWFAPPWAPAAGEPEAAMAPEYMPGSPPPPPAIDAPATPPPPPEEDDDEEKA